MKNNFLQILFLLYASFCFSQQKVTWQDLSKITFADKYFEEYDDYFMYPTFLSSVKELEGKQITIKGYFLDVVQKDKVYILSKGPMSSCFFCGEGGPETAVELHFTEKAKFKTDDIVAVTGVLKLNRDDVDHFNYILSNCKAELIK